MTDHDAALAAARAQTPPAELSRDELLAMVRWRLDATAALPEPLPGHARELVPGLVQHLVLDYPASVAPLPDAVAERFAPGELADAATRNGLAALEADDLEVEVVPAGGDSSIEVVLGDSWFVASHALHLPELLGRLHPGVELEEGVLLTLPGPGALAYHLPSTAGGVRAAMGQLLSHAHWYAGQDRRPVCLDLLHWHDGTWRRVSETTTEGVRVSPTGRLAALLGMDA